MSLFGGKKKPCLGSVRGGHVKARGVKRLQCTCRAGGRLLTGGGELGFV